VQGRIAQAASQRAAALARTLAMPPAPRQVGLFDRRAEHILLEADAARDAVLARASLRQRRAEAAGRIEVGSAELVLILLPGPSRGCA
jgi:hypothetical protein